MALKLDPRDEPIEARYPRRRAPRLLAAALRGAAGAAGAALAIALACCGGPQAAPDQPDPDPTELGGAVVAPTYAGDPVASPAPEQTYDADADGLGDDRDQCPQEPEDLDGFADEDGCPDPDNDHDGLADASDRCPNEPEDLDGVEDLDGCPEPY